MTTYRSPSDIQLHKLQRPQVMVNHSSDFTRASCRPKLPATQLAVQQLVQAKAIKTPWELRIGGLLLGESTDPHTKVR